MRASVVDGLALSPVERRAEATALGRAFMTPGMIGCYLSHRRCWAECARTGAPLIVFEDDVALAEPATFAAAVSAGLREVAALDATWDVLLLGALGCVHPDGWRHYGANVLHGLVGGGLRWPRRLSPTIHVPARPFGTHAYVLSPAGARKLLATCPRASFHVDVVAWGQRSLRLYSLTRENGRMLATQAPTSETTIGGLADRSWLPSFTVDAYTGAEFSWAFNAPILRLPRLFVLTIGRSLGSTAALLLAAAATRICGHRHAPLWQRLAMLWLVLQLVLLELLKAQQASVGSAAAGLTAALALVAIGGAVCVPPPSPSPLDAGAALGAAGRRLLDLLLLPRTSEAEHPQSLACVAVAPSATAWARALSIHLGLLAFVGAPLGLLLFVVGARLRRTRPGPHGGWHVRLGAGVGFGLAAGVAVPLAVAYGRRHHPAQTSWMAAFLAATFGFNAFFKCAAFAARSHPAGADVRLGTWLLWFTSLPEPLLLGASGELQPPRAGRAAGGPAWRTALLLLKLAGLSALLSVLLASPANLPFGMPPAGLAGWPAHVLNCWAHLWLVYLWAAFCLDVGTLLVMGVGGTTEPAFGNPLLASRSLREAWGERWNRPVHTLLKRSVYEPARRSLGLPPLSAALLTFAASGLLHEYNFSIHNHAGYEPGAACLFFVAMGALMLAEATLAPCCPPPLRRLLGAMPSALIAAAIQLVVLPLFAPFFMRSWLASGMIDDLRELVPHVRCTGGEGW